MLAAMSASVVIAQESAPAASEAAKPEQAVAAYPLHEAAARGDVEACRRILRENESMDLNRRDVEGRTALHVAAAHDHEEICTLLLRNGAYAFAEDDRGRTPVMLAAESGAEKACVPLMLMGALGNPDDLSKCMRPVRMALEREHAQTLYLLLTSISPKFLEHIEKLATPGTPVPAMPLYRDALQRARNQWDKEGDAYTPNCSWGKLALHYWECINGRSTLKDLPCIPMLAAMKPDVLSTAALREMVQAGADIEAVMPSDNTPRTALEIAVVNADVRLCAMLLEVGADPMHRNRFGKTPLHQLPSSEASVELARLLLQAGADPNAEDDNHFTPFWNNLRHGELYLNIRRELAAGPIKVQVEEPLVLAASLNYTDTCERLIQEGADVNAVWKKRYMTPLYWAAVIGNVELMHMLLKAGANPSTEEFSVFCEAAAVNNVESCAALLDAGVSPVHETRGWTTTALHRAAGAKAYQVCKMLLEKGMDPNVLDRDNRTPLMVVAGEGQRGERICDLLLAAGARAELADKDGTTALHEATRSMSMLYSDTLVCKLLAAGADVNATNKWYDTPLHCAVQSGNVQACRTLLEAGADLSLSVRSIAKVTKEGHIMWNSRDLPKRLEIGSTPLELARAFLKYGRSYSQLLSVLEEYATKAENKPAEQAEPAAQ